MRLIAVGTLRADLEGMLYREYERRLVRPLHVTEVSAKKYKTAEQQESAILALIKNTDTVIALDERGLDWSTKDLDQFLKASELSGESVVFLIGGADGFSDRLRQRARHCLRFGKMTWPHGLVRVLLLEQLYRCQQIRLNHPYHREG